MFLWLVIVLTISVSVSSHEHKLNWVVPPANSSESFNDWASNKRFQVGDIIRKYTYPTQLKNFQLFNIKFDLFVFLTFVLFLLVGFERIQVQERLSDASDEGELQAMQFFAPEILLEYGQDQIHV